MPRPAPDSDDPATRLAAAARERFAPRRLATRAAASGYTIDILAADGHVLWPDYSHGPDELRAVLAAEQRYLVEQAGAGSVPGATYLDKANERIRRSTVNPT